MQKMPQKLPCHGNCIAGDPSFSAFSSNPGCLVGFFTRLSFDADRRAVLARLERLILLVGPIYSHFLAARWSELDGGCIACPFDVATSLEANRVAHPTISTTVSSGR
jgi:hypothetical protein